MNRILFGLCVLLWGCSEKSEEERLADMLDTTVVHVYAGARTVVTGTSNDPALADARRAIVEALTAEDQTRPEERAVRTAKMLAGLAKLGKNPRKQDQGPLVPAVMTLVAPGSRLPAAYGIDEDHAYLGAAWWLLKAHPDAPGVPHMDLFSTWEVTRMSKNGLAKSPMRAVARLIRAVQFGEHDLCAMSAVETAELRRTGISMGPAIALSGGTATAAQVESFDRVSRVGASAETALCYLQRGDRASALPHVEAVTNEASAVGVPETKVAMLKAYVAFEKGDVPGAIRALEVARRDPDLSAEDRATVDRMIGYLRNRSDAEFVAAITDKAFFADIAIRIVLRWAEQSGVGAEIRSSPAGRSVERFGDRIGRAVSSLDPREAVSKGAEELRKRLGQ